MTRAVREQAIEILLIAAWWDRSMGWGDLVQAADSIGAGYQALNLAINARQAYEVRACTCRQAVYALAAQLLSEGWTP